MSEQVLSREDKQKLYLRDVVMRQTDYTAEEATKKLEEFNNDVILIFYTYRSCCISIYIYKCLFMMYVYI